MSSFVEIGTLVLEKEIFEGFFTIYGHGGHLGHVTWISCIHIGSPFLLMLHIKFGFDWPSGFKEEDLRKWWTTDDDDANADGRTSGASLSYNLANKRHKTEILNKNENHS